MDVIQVTPQKLIMNKEKIDDYLQRTFSTHLEGKVWMGSLENLLKRFKMNDLIQMSENELLDYQWDEDHINSIITRTIEQVRGFIPLHIKQITVVPARPFAWFADLDQSKWKNGYTNGPNQVIIAIPPKPDTNYLQNLLAHECHHASNENPIYELTLENFTLLEWYKMEGTAEYFSLKLFPDNRWWLNEFTEEVEETYWNKVKDYLDTSDDVIKSKLCFGNKEEGIPTFSGYSFGLKLVSYYMDRHPNTKFSDLFYIEPRKLIQVYSEGT